MNKRNIEAVYPLSPMQQGMLFHSIYSPESGVYFEQLTARLEGDLDVGAFQKAWQQVVQNHSILRTSFVWKRLDKTLQVVHKQVNLPFDYQDWSEFADSTQEQRLNDYIEENRQRGFNLSVAPLLRLALIRLANNRFQFIWWHHHLLLDGWSIPLVIKEVFTRYEALRQQQELHLPPARPYRDYINWLGQQDEQVAENFWRKTLAGFTAPTSLQIEPVSADGEKDKRGYAEQEIHLSEKMTSELQAFARQNQLTLNTLVQGAWALLLNAYSGEEDVVFGATVAGRPADLPNVEAMVGLFINTLPVRVQIDPEASVMDWLKQLQVQQIELRQFEYSSLTQIQGWSEVPRDLPLFESILVFENYPVDSTLREQNTSLKVKKIQSKEMTNYPITLVASPEREFFLKMAYDSQRFSDTTIKQMLLHLKNIIEQFLVKANEKIRNLHYLSQSEQQQILIDWNQTQTDFSVDKCVHELFEEVVAKFPHSVALTFENQTVTYQELNQRANQLAHFLQKEGIQAEDLVGICMERSPEMIVAMLGVLKAGGAYLPLDPNYPADRLAFIYQDANVAFLLTQNSLVNLLPQTTAKVIALDAEGERLANEKASNPESNVTPDNLAYVIYTSGSTGHPKGTLLNQRGLVNFITAYTKIMDVGSNDKVLQFASISFDASVAEIYEALLAGANLCLAPQETLLSVAELTQLLKIQAATSVTLPPSLLAILPSEGLPALKSVMSAGESCTREIVERWTEGRKFLNGYGPTEATVGATWLQIENLPEGTHNLPIGKAIANKKLFIVDQYLRPVPVGVAGELLIGGEGLARGYLNRPELTAEKFIPNPFAGAEGERLYRTGDLVRYLADGTIEFIGRIDYQVKVRGFRIELGEIEAVLREHPSVTAATVLAREDKPGHKRLVAYLILDQQLEQAPTTTELHQFLKERLPEYMVPSFFMILDEFPLTPAGKVNRRALPAPEVGRPELGRAFVAPRTPVEELLAGIWAQVLGVAKVGIHDDFFELGGHSLLGVKLQSRLRDAFNIELPLREIFEAPTVAELAQVVERAKLATHGLELPPIKPVPREQELPLSFAQQRLWFLDQLEPNSTFYNIPAGLRLSGQLNIQALEKSINELVKRHESLRTTFKSVRGKPFQVIAPELSIKMTVEDLSQLTPTEQEHKIQNLAMAEAEQPFNLSEGPLFRVKLYQVAETEHVILFNMHHIISDGWSVGVLIREVAALYQAFSVEGASPLEDLPIQYADFAHWQREWLKDEVLQEQLNYWKKQLAGSPPVLELPTDRPRPAVQSFCGTTFSRVFPKKLLTGLQHLSQQKGVTLFMTLLAAFKTLLYRHTGQSDINVGTPHANRNRVETENLIGFFVNTLVLRSDLSGNPKFTELLQQVRETAFEAYAHQDLPFEMLVEALQPKRDLSHTPLFQVMFVLQNAPMEPLELSGLTFSPLETASGTAKFDLSLVLAEMEDGLSVSFEYNTDLFDESTIVRLMDHFEILLTGIIEKPEQRIGELSILTESEQQQMLVQWNATETDFPADKCMHQWFETLAAEKPAAIAVSFNDQQLTYQELNERANQLARYLQKFDLGEEGLVGICMERSLEMVVSILGTLKAGGAFIPLDPAYPQDRLSFMITDSVISVLLTQQELAEHFTNHATKIISVDAEWDSIAREQSDNLNLPLDPLNLAYVIYTSGSTGKPKGTMLQHYGWCNLGRAQQLAFGVGPGSRILQFSSLSFDASVWEIVMALLSGATLCLTNRELLTTGQGLLEVLEQGNITTVTLPPSVLAVVPTTTLPDLSTIITAGEACSADLVARWATGRDFFNAYGPTETTVCASMYRVEENGHQNPPIGKPIANFKLYILDANLQPLPIGVPGELFIGGISLARGYLKRPGLTAEKFVPDPFSKVPGARLYRSGDLVKYLTDGNIEFLGRIDHQVKVRGFRIELGEIEAALDNHPDIRDVIVLARDFKPGDKRLVAYLVAEPGVELTISELRAYLRKELPEYMVPSAFMILDEFPLTPNGKINRKALPEPDQSHPELGSEYLAPRNKTEEILADICKELLSVERVGVYDNFFDLGGHSLLATQFISRVRESFEVELPLRTLFESPTIGELTEKIQTLPKLTEAEQAGQIESTERGDKNLDELLAELEGMSDEEVQTQMLEEMNLKGNE